jgi:hypothetical protein
MGLILDLAVVAVALLVVGSLAVLAWTLAVGGTVAADRGRRRIADARATIAGAEAGLGATTQAEGDGPTA